MYIHPPNRAHSSEVGSSEVGTPEVGTVKRKLGNTPLVLID